MEFNGEKFVVDGEELYRAQLGFEIIGSADLSDRLVDTEFEHDENIALVDDVTARLIVAGNIALLNNTELYKTMSWSSPAEQFQLAALQTTSSGLRAIEQRQKQ